MPNIKPEILLWARNKMMLSTEEAAQKLSLKDTRISTAVEKLTSFENGEAEPSRSLLLRMSKQYHVPLLLFYLNKPPLIANKGQDFRTLPADHEKIEDVNVDILIRDVKARQSTVKATLIAEDDYEYLEFISSHKIEDGIAAVIGTIRKYLDFDLEKFRSKKNYKEAFQILRKKVESHGIFILLKGNLGSYHSNIPTTVFRGFALSDNVAPFIVINDQDSAAAWSFTLLHELTHLILGQTGISSTYFESTVEKFCNNVASEFFLPADEFKEFKLSYNKFDDIIPEITQYAASLNLSNTHIAYRLYKRGDITRQRWNKLRSFYYQKWTETQENIKVKNSKKDGGPNHYVVKKYKLGNLVRLVERLTFAGALSTSKAGMLLETKPLKVHKLFQT